MGIEVKQGLSKVGIIELLHDNEDFTVYLVHTVVKQPEVVSWNSSSISFLRAGFMWEHVKPSDYTVIRFPEKKGFTSVYQEDRYVIYFIQFRENHDSRVVWEQSNVK